MRNQKKTLPFWKTKSLSDMTEDEWESLCDGCAKCCLQKLEYDDTGEVCQTCIACRYLDEDTCRCTQYGQRAKLVPTCLQLQPDNLSKIYFLPDTCAYRLLLEGSDLKWWHPLVSGDPNSVHGADISVRGKVLCEDKICPDDWEKYIIV